MQKQTLLDYSSDFEESASNFVFSDDGKKSILSVELKLLINFSNWISRKRNQTANARKT